MAINPGTWNPKVQRRADWDFDLVFKDSSDAAINLTGYTVASQVWDKPRTSKFADMTVAYTNRAAGTVKISLSKAQTTLLPDTAYYDIKLTNGAGLEEYYLEGKMTVSEGYTD
jgi:NAD dependent epimerase/dehydratase family enzyme